MLKCDWCDITFKRLFLLITDSQIKGTHFIKAGCTTDTGINKLALHFGALIPKIIPKKSLARRGLKQKRETEYLQKVQTE